MKWVVLGLVVLIGGGSAFGILVGNPRVERELRENPQGELARESMLLTLPDRRTLPVNYLREGNVIYAGADGPWWRTIRGEGAAVSLFVMGEHLEGYAIAVEDDPDRKRDVFARLRPTAPAWLPAWLNGILVVIELQLTDQGKAS